MKDIKKEMCNCENCEGACKCNEGICNCENCSCKINEEVEEVKDFDGDIPLGEIYMNKENGLVYMTLPILENISPTPNQLALLQKSIDLFQQFLLEVILDEDEINKMRIDYLSSEIEKKKEAVEEAKELLNIKQGDRVNEVVDADGLNE